MLAMFGVFAFLFFKDWKFGYPEKNVQRFYYLAFEQAKEEFARHQQEEESATDWESFAASKRVFVSPGPGEEVKDVSKVVPADTDLDTPWPAMLQDYEGYQALYEKEKSSVVPAGWSDFAKSDGRKWKEQVKDHLKNENSIKEQLWIGILCLVLFLGALFVLLRTMARSMTVDSEGFSPPGGDKVLFSEMRRLDIRKWDTKGLATVFYEKGGGLKKAKIDGMVYGQFKAEEGAPAQKLFEKIRENFRGELIEFAAEEEEKTEESAVKDDSEV